MKIFVRHKSSHNFPRKKEKVTPILFFFSVFFCFHFRKCSHFLVFSVVSCGLQIESSMRLSLPGHKFGSASSFWSFALSHFIWNFFFFFLQPFLLLSCTVSGLSRTAPGTLNSLCLWHKFACFPRKFFNLNRPRRVLARSHDAPTKEKKK